MLTINLCLMYVDDTLVRKESERRYQDSKQIQDTTEDAS